MKRWMNFSTPAYVSPEGSLSGGVSPIYGYHPPYNVVIEPISKTRPISDILGYFELKTYLMGPFPGELFSQIILTTKPHTTFATFNKSNRRDFYDAGNLSTLLPEQLSGRINVINVINPKGDIKKSDIAHHEIRGGDIVLLRTDISKNHRQLYPTKSYYTDHPGLSFEAAEYLAGKNIKAVGIDARNIEPIDPANRGTISVVQLLNDAGIVVVQDLADLSVISEKQTWAIIGIPLKIEGVIGGPARVIAINPENPLDYSDLSHKIKTYPSNRYDRKHGWMAPLPKRIEPRDMQNELQASCRILPFILQGEDTRTPDGTSQEMYIWQSHGTNTHAESAFFDPLGVHNTPEEILCRYKEMPLDRLIGPACLLDLNDKIGPRQQIDVHTLEESGVQIQKGDILFIRTEINDWYMWGNAMDITPGFTLSAAKWLVSKGIRAIAVDFTSVERSNPPSGIPKMHYTANDVHYTLHNNDIPVIERVARLGLIRKERFSVAVLPFPGHNLGGFPVDIFAWEDWD